MWDSQTPLHLRRSAGCLLGQSARAARRWLPARPCHSTSALHCTLHPTPSTPRADGQTSEQRGRSQGPRARWIWLDPSKRPPYPPVLCSMPTMGSFFLIFWPVWSFEIGGGCPIFIAREHGPARRRVLLPSDPPDAPSYSSHGLAAGCRSFGSLDFGNT